MASRGSTSPIWQVLPAMQAIAQPLLMRLETALGGADGSSVSAGEVANALEQLYAEIYAEIYAAEISAEVCAAETWSRWHRKRRVHPDRNVWTTCLIWQVRASSRSLAIVAERSRRRAAGRGTPVRPDARAAVGRARPRLRALQVVVVPAVVVPAVAVPAVVVHARGDASRLISANIRRSNDSRVMEKLCRCYKHTAKNCGADFKAVVPKLLPLVVGW